MYYQNLPSFEDSENNFETRIKSDDLLMIIVSAPGDAAKDFNLPIVAVTGTDMFSSSMDMASGQQRVQTYLVDNEGFIQFPVLGKLEVAGRTKNEVIEMLNEKLSEYLKDYVVNLRIVNFEIVVSGEVARPGRFTLQTERITLPEALAMAGDMTVYGKRDNVLVRRDVNGKKTFNYIDMTKADFINSPFYYLEQNDEVYVEPNKTKINSSGVGPNVSVIISATSVLIALIAILTR
ncbi:Periplasmic protein involved in polysaccharide export [Flavobacterium beibuense]|uniref:Periplasmic protein involved in polysaccharide export n=1 Tax=Flavobacterium beibuense TaxID=657326 RepID=A0A444WI97_9FLAO|nr:Periplasmic protein involved in polysaccharide export [Flavobacterium beibuense]